MEVFAADIMAAAGIIDTGIAVGGAAATGIRVIGVGDMRQLIITVQLITQATILMAITGTVAHQYPSPFLNTNLIKSNTLKSNMLNEKTHHTQWRVFISHQQIHHPFHRSSYETLIIIYRYSLSCISHCSSG
jgi:hypothetical protein